jgi:hypothetical protein
LEADFRLQDKFCDARDLEKSWKDIAIPPPLLKFLGALFKFDPKQLECSSIQDGDVCDEEEDEAK